MRPRLFSAEYKRGERVLVATVEVADDVTLTERSILELEANRELGIHRVHVETPLPDQLQLQFDRQCGTPLFSALSASLDSTSCRRASSMCTPPMSSVDGRSNLEVAFAFYGVLGENDARDGERSDGEHTADKCPIGALRSRCRSLLFRPPSARHA